MPHRECREPSCHTLVKIEERGKYYCPRHQKRAPKPWDPTTRKTPRNYQAEDERRQSSSSRGYGWRWQKARKAFLREHPFCAEHAQALAPWNTVPVPASVVDHIIPHNGDEELFWDQSNWQALCKPCHDRKSARERLSPSWKHKGATPQ